MNVTFPQRVIDRMMEENPAKALAEYGAQFRSGADARDEAGDGVGEVVVAAGRMVDLVAPGARGVTLQRGDLLNAAGVIEQGDVAGVEHRQQMVGVELALGLLRELVGDAALLQRLPCELAAEGVTLDREHAVLERHSLEQNRRAAAPSDPSGYKAELPSDFVVPPGVEFQLDEKHPLMPQARQLAHDIDQGKIGGQEALSRLLALHGASEIARVQQFDRQVQAEVQKLGATGTTRVTTIQNFIKSIAPEDTIRDLYAGLISEKAVRGWEALMRRFESQGAGSYSHAHRDAPEGNGTIPGYEKMSFEQRLAAADAAKRGAR
jgi:hypothetical protein